MLATRSMNRAAGCNGAGVTARDTVDEGGRPCRADPLDEQAPLINVISRPEDDPAAVLVRGQARSCRYIRYEASQKAAINGENPYLCQSAVRRCIVPVLGSTAGFVRSMVTFDVAPPNA
jgi:hypothetical protein